MIYLVVQGAYSDWDIVGYFTNRKEAEKYCLLKGGELDFPYVLECENLGGKADLSKVKVYYKHKVAFYLDENSNTWAMRSEPDSYILTNHFEPAQICDGELVFGRYYKNIEVIVTIDEGTKGREKAEKIAQDELYKYLAEKQI